MARAPPLRRARGAPRRGRGRRRAGVAGRRPPRPRGQRKPRARAPGARALLVLAALLARSPAPAHAPLCPARARLARRRPPPATLSQGPKKRVRVFKKFTYRGVDLDKLLEMGHADVIELLPARLRRRFDRGLSRKYTTLLKKLRKAKRETKADINAKPVTVKTHLRDMPILPEMVGSQVAVYSGRVFNVVEIKPEMIGHYLAEYSISYKPTLHGRPGLGATHSSRFIPLK